MRTRPSCLIGATPCISRQKSSSSVSCISGSGGGSGLGFATGADFSGNLIVFFKLRNGELKLDDDIARMVPCVADQHKQVGNEREKERRTEFSDCTYLLIKLQEMSTVRPMGRLDF